MENKLNLDEIEKLPAKERALLKKRHALHCKYEKAVTLYADTTLSTRIIALRCGVTPGALGNYLRRYWRVHIPEHTRSLSGSLLGYKTIP